MKIARRESREREAKKKREVPIFGKECIVSKEKKGKRAGLLHTRGKSRWKKAKKGKKNFGTKEGRTDGARREGQSRKKKKLATQ